MTVEKSRKVNWLNITSILLGVVGILSICPAVTVILFFDSPSPDWNANYFFILSVISFPIVCIGSSIGIWFLKNKHGALAFSAAVLPVLSLILIFAGSAWMSLASCGKFDCSIPTMQEQGAAIHVGKCTLPLLNVGDGLETTGCGVLEAGVSATGIIENTSDAHNWQFSVQSSDPIRITIELAGNSCSRIGILDSHGSLIENFEDRNDNGMCPGGMSAGMTTTSFYHFDPPDTGTYILRITAPKAPSTYWLKIEQDKNE